MTETKAPEGPKSRRAKAKDAAKGVLYGMAAHGHVTAALRTRMYLEHLFMFITLGENLEGLGTMPWETPFGYVADTSMQNTVSRFSTAYGDIRS